MQAKNLVTIFILSFSLLFCSSCGQRGPLYLPDPAQKDKP